MEYQLRSALKSDRPFLYKLRCVTMRDHIEKTWGWDDIQECKDFRQRFRWNVVSIIEVGSRDVGGLWLEPRPDSFYVAELQVLPEMQGRGIGTAVLQGVIAEAAARGLPVDLVVLQVNEGARRLYARLGFRVTTLDAQKVCMRYDQGVA